MDAHLGHLALELEAGPAERSQATGEFDVAPTHALNPSLRVH